MKTFIGYVAVDSASVVIADPVSLPSWIDSRDENSINDLLPEGAESLNDMHNFESPKDLPFSDAAAWVARCSKDRGGILGRFPNQDYGQGIAVATGWGDGLYPVYADLSHGVVNSVTIEFVSDEDDDE